MKRTIHSMTHALESDELIHGLRSPKRCVSPMSGGSPTPNVQYYSATPPSPPLSTWQAPPLVGELPYTEEGSLPSISVSVISDELTLSERLAAAAAESAAKPPAQSWMPPRPPQTLAASWPGPSTAPFPPLRRRLMSEESDSSCRRHRRNTTELVGNEGIFMQATTTHCCG